MVTQISVRFTVRLTLSRIRNIECYEMSLKADFLSLRGNLCGLNFEIGSEAKLARINAMLLTGHFSLYIYWTHPYIVFNRYYLRISDFDSPVLRLLLLNCAKWPCLSSFIPSREEWIIVMYLLWGQCTFHWTVEIYQRYNINYADLMQNRSLNA